MTDEAAFEALLAPVAAGVGLPFTLAEAREYANRSRALNDEEFAELPGGSGCYVIGGGTGPDAGVPDYENFGACAYVGVSLAFWS